LGPIGASAGEALHASLLGARIALFVAMSDRNLVTGSPA